MSTAGGRVAFAGDTVPAIPDSMPVMPAVIVTAKRPDPLRDVTTRPGFVAMVDMSARKDRVEDLPRILSQLVGVRVTQYGGLGDFATVSIRGSSSSQVRTFLDGIPIDDPYLGITNIADLPLDGVDRVEVYRGFSPPSLGGSAIGGAVQLVTKMEGTHDATLSGARAGLSMGSFDTSRETASLWLKPGPIRVFAHGTHERSDGDFEFHDDNGTPNNDNDDETATRINNDFEGWSGIMRAAADVPHTGKATASYYETSRESGVPGLGSFQSATARSERRRRMGQIGIDGLPLFCRRVQWWANGFYQRAHERFIDRDADISFVPEDTDNRIDAYGGSARVKWLVPWIPFALDASYVGKKDTFHPEDQLPTPSSGPDRWRHATTASIGGELHLWQDVLVLSGEQRFEANVDEFFDEPRFPWLPPTTDGRVKHEARTPHAAARVRIQPWLLAKGNIGRYYRLPTFLELFGNTGSVTGTSSLEPETGKNWDAGVVTSLGRHGALRSLFFEVCYFHNDIDDLILYFQNSQYTVKPANVGAARVHGVEISTTAGLGARLDLSAGYTRTDSEDTSDIPYYRGNELPSRPRDVVNASLAYHVSIVTATYEFQFLSSNWLDRANLNEAPARELHSLAVNMRTPVTGLGLTVEGRNLFDERPVDVAGYPLPGRSFYSTLVYHY